MCSLLYNFSVAAFHNEKLDILNFIHEFANYELLMLDSKLCNFMRTRYRKICSLSHHRIKLGKDFIVDLSGTLNELITNLFFNLDNFYSDLTSH